MRTTDSLFSAIFLVPASCQTYPLAQVTAAFGPFLGIQWTAVSLPAKKHGTVLSNMVRYVCQWQQWPVLALLACPVRNEPAATSLSHAIPSQFRQMEHVKLLQQAFRQLQCIFLLPSPKEAACFQLYGFGTRILTEWRWKSPGSLCDKWCVHCSDAEKCTFGLAHCLVFTNAVNDLWSSSHQGLQTVTAFESGAKFWKELVSFSSTVV